MIQEVSYKLNNSLNSYVSAHIDSFNKYKHLRSDVIKNGVISTFIDSGIGAGIGYNLAGADGAGLGASIGVFTIFSTNFFYNVLKGEFSGIGLVDQFALEDLKKDLKLSDDQIEGYLRQKH